MNIKDFYEMKSITKGRCNVRIHCVISDLTRNEIGELGHRYGAISDQITTYPLVNLSKDYAMPRDFGEAELSATADDERCPCEFLWSVLYICAEGNVVRCYKDHQYGNDLTHVDNMSLLGIWNSHIKNERQRHISNSLISKSCERCNVWKMMPPPYHYSNIVKERIRQTIKRIFYHADGEN
jgi:radical SAM protein with 4Fe4S-binding SPASM domain